LAALAVLGFLLPNGIFVYFALAERGAVIAALTNPVSLVFVLEAFFLMGLFAWLLQKRGRPRHAGLLFVVASLLGSMACSVPAAILLLSRKPSKLHTRGTPSGPP
jgi:hypothetical protein